MTRTDSPLHQLIVWVAGPADGRHGRLVASAWAASRPVLAGYASVGEVVRAGWADPNRAAVLLTELSNLAAIDDGGGVAVQAALAILAPALGRVVARWARAGVPAGELEDMEADLLVEATAVLRARPGPQPPPAPAAVIDIAWARARTSRRRHRRAAARVVPLDPAAVSRESPRSVDVSAAAEVVVDGFRSGRLSLAAAQVLWATGVAGWSGAEAAERLGCAPAALRARRSRAIRAIRAIRGSAAAA